MIKIEKLNYSYKNGKNVLEDINLNIDDGEIVSIIGKNGTGKSTLLRLIAGIMKLNSGKILIDDIDISDKKKFIEIRKRVGIVFQNPDNQILFPKVYNDIEFALKNLDLDNKEERIKNALEMVNMLEYQDEDSYKLSLGQKQRINIASVLAVNPKYILMDEPTTMIDSKEKDNIYDIIKQLKKNGTTIIFVTNNINEILLSDRIIMLENKTIKHYFNKENILENIELLENSDIKIPNLINILFRLKNNNIEFNLKEWTSKEIENEIVRLCNR